MKRLVTFLVSWVALGLPSHAMAVDVAHIRCAFSTGVPIQESVTGAMFSSGVNAPASCVAVPPTVGNCPQCLADLQSSGFSLQGLGYTHFQSGDTQPGDALYVLKR
jgi:hypothetical protein